MTGTIIKLLDVMHAQWLYGCIQTHDKAVGMLWTLHNEELQREIDQQLETGSEDLLEEDQYLAEVNMEDLESSLRERQEYWLVAIKAVREASRLRGIQQQMVCRGNGVDRGR
jgi:hypothetical protein